MNLNRVVLVGRLSSKPETRATGAGVLITTFSLAVNEFYKGEKKVSFIYVEVVGEVAENINKKIQKGTRIALEGFLRQERLKGKNKTIYERVVVMAQKVFLI